MPVSHQFCFLFGDSLSFSSFYSPSVDSGHVASLLGLALIVFVKVGSGGVRSFLTEERKLLDRRKVGGWKRHCGLFKILICRFLALSSSSVVHSTASIQPGLGRGLRPPPQYFSYPNF